MVVAMDVHAMVPGIAVAHVQREPIGEWSCWFNWDSPDAGAAIQAVPMLYLSYIQAESEVVFGTVLTQLSSARTAETVTTRTPTTSAGYGRHRSARAASAPVAFTAAPPITRTGGRQRRHSPSRARLRGAERNLFNISEHADGERRGNCAGLKGTMVLYIDHDTIYKP